MFSYLNKLFTNPSRQQVILFSSLWLFGSFCLVAAATNGFTERLFRSRFLLIYFVWFTSMISLLKIISLYLAAKRSEHNAER